MAFSVFWSSFSVFWPDFWCFLVFLGIFKEGKGFTKCGKRPNYVNMLCGGIYSEEMGGKGVLGRKETKK